MVWRGFGMQLIGNAQKEAPEGVVGDRVIGFFHRVLAQTAGEIEHGESENDEDEIGRFAPASTETSAIGVETRPEELDLHPYPREKSYEAESCRYGND